MPKMLNLRALAAQADARRACEMMRQHFHQDARIIWIAGITLVRSVGHILQKHDAVVHPTIAQPLKGFWAAWQNEIIFKKFIEPERNVLLKELGTAFETEFISEGLRFQIDLGDLGLQSPIGALELSVAWWGQKISDLGQACGAQFVPDASDTPALHDNLGWIGITGEVEGQ